jgi:hypothetical protein
MDLMDLRINDIVEIIRLDTKRRIITWVVKPSREWGHGPEITIYVRHDSNNERGDEEDKWAHSTEYADIKFLFRPADELERDAFITLSQ